MIDKECKYIISITIVGNDIKKPCCCLIICRSRSLYKGTRKKIQATFLSSNVIYFLINEHNKVITKPINLLLAILERTTRLWLFD